MITVMHIHVLTKTKITTESYKPENAEKYAILSFDELNIFLYSIDDVNRAAEELAKIHKFLSEVESEQNK